MKYMNIAILLIYCVLAIISRKHFSKYKDGKRQNLVCRVFYGMAETIYGFIWNREGRYKRFFIIDSIENTFRKIKVLSVQELSSYVKQYVTEKMMFCLMIIFCTNMIVLGMEISGGFRKESKNMIEREDYNGNTKTQEIYYWVEDKQEEISLEVNPVQYTNQEFLEKTEIVFQELEKTILAENEDKNHIRSDLFLPSWDETETFRITYSSSRPEVISSYGLMDNANLTEDVEVIITAKIKYLDYVATREYCLIVMAQKGNSEITDYEKVSRKLSEIEESSRTSKNFEIPKEIDGMRLTLKSKTGDKSVQIFLFGIIGVFAFLILSKYRTKEAIEKRNNMLEKQYGTFVQSFCLFLGTGMSTKNAFEKVVEEMQGQVSCMPMKSKIKQDNILMKEIKYTINEIQTGCDEASSYEALGMRLEIPMYVRFFNRISQNLRLGTTDLRKVLEDEMKVATEEQKAFVLKKSEEAATKLLLPMGVLLLIVMIIVVAPAIYNF